MFSYLTIKADIMREDDGGVGERARASEVARQQLEERAWLDHQSRKAVSRG